MQPTAVNQTTEGSTGPRPEPRKSIVLFFGAISNDRICSRRYRLLPEGDDILHWELAISIQQQYPVACGVRNSRRQRGGGPTIDRMMDWLNQGILASQCFQ